MANKGTKLAYLAGSAVGLWLIAKKKQESLELDPDHVLVENTGEERDTNSASNYVSVGAVGGRMELGVEQNDLNDIILFAQNGMYNKILLEIAMGFDAADVSGYNLFKDSLEYFETLYETYPDDEGMTPAEEKERESMLNSMLLMAYLAFPTDEVKLVDEYLKRATGIGGVGEIIDTRTFGGYAYDMSDEEQKYASICEFSALADDIDYNHILNLYKKMRGNQGWDSMAAICGYLVMRDARITTPSTNERNIWVYDFAAYSLVGDLHEIVTGKKTRKEVVDDLRRTIQLLWNI